MLGAHRSDTGTLADVSHDVGRCLDDVYGRAVAGPYSSDQAFHETGDVAESKTNHIHDAPFVVVSY